MPRARPTQQRKRAWTVSENESEGTSVVMVRSSEDRLQEAQELDRLIREDEEALLAAKANASTIGKRIQEMTLQLRTLLRQSSTPLPLFDAGSESSTDGAAPPSA